MIINNKYKLIDISDKLVIDMPKIEMKLYSASVLNQNKSVKIAIVNKEIIHPFENDFELFPFASSSLVRECGRCEGGFYFVLSEEKEKTTSCMDLYFEINSIQINNVTNITDKRNDNNVSTFVSRNNVNQSMAKQDIQFKKAVSTNGTNISSSVHSAICCLEEGYRIASRDSLEFHDLNFKYGVVSGSGFQVMIYIDRDDMRIAENILMFERANGWELSADKKYIQKIVNIRSDESPSSFERKVWGALKSIHPEWICDEKQGYIRAK